MATLLVLSGVTEPVLADEMIAGTYTGPHRPSHVGSSIALLDGR